MTNKHVDIERTIYYLKRRRGENIILYAPSDSRSTNVTTGVMTNPESAYKIRNVILISHSDARKLFLAKTGVYDVNEKTFIIDSKNLNDNIILKENMVFKHQDIKYRIKKIERSVNNQVFIIRAEGLENYD